MEGGEELVFIGEGVGDVELALAFAGFCEVGGEGEEKGGDDPGPYPGT